MSLDWDDVDGATHYLVRWRVAGPGNTLNAGVQVQSSDAGITVDDYGEWVVRVEACNDAGCGSPGTSRFEVEETAPAQLGNSPPTFDGGAGPLTRSVAENSAADTAVGAAVAATDPDGDTLAYTLTGADAASFTVDANGQIEVGSGTTLDYETTTAYSVTVNVSDGVNAAGGADTAIDASVVVTISVTDVLETVATPLAEPLFFPYVIGALVLERPGDIGDTTMPKAEGGEGEFTYTLTGLPHGLSFDPDTRILSGSVAAGGHTLTYTATDEAGVKDAQTFTLTVGPVRPEGGSGVSGRSTGGVRGQGLDIHSGRPNVRDMGVGRKTYTEQSAPGLTVTWNAPDMSSGTSGEGDLVIAQYEAAYSKLGTGVFMYLYISSDSTSVAITGLEPGTQYKVQVRVKYSQDRYTEWQFANALGLHTTNRLPKPLLGDTIPTYILEWGGNDRVETISDDFTDPDGDRLTYSVSSTPAGIVTATLEDVEEDGNIVKKLRLHLLNPASGAVTVTYGAHDGYGGYVSQDISVGGIANQDPVRRPGRGRRRQRGRPGGRRAIRRRRR